MQTQADKDGLGFAVLGRMKVIAKRMRLKGSRLLQIKPMSSTLMARAETWEHAAQLLEQEIDAFDR